METIKKKKKIYRPESTSTANSGKKFVDEFLGKYGNLPIKELDTVYSENGLAKTVLICWMMRHSNISLERLAKYLGCQTQSLRNKMVRDSFSFEDLVICAHACKCSIQIKDNESPDENNILTITPSDFFKVSDLEKSTEDQVLKRLERLDKENHIKEAEYLELKEKLERMQAEYGFK